MCNIYEYILNSRTYYPDVLAKLWLKNLFPSNRQIPKVIQSK